MGLDMYLCEKLFNGSGKQVGSDEIAYWRKHHDLHGWMENLYRSRGGEGDFNCVNLDLTMGNLLELERCVKENELPHTEGFFFGNNPPDKDSVLQDLKIIERAKCVIRGGGSIYYCSWW